MPRSPHVSHDAPLRVAVVGAGYVGLTTAAGLAALGHGVVAVDRDQDRIRRLRAGECPLHEPGLPSLLTRLRLQGRLHFSTSLAGVLAQRPDVIVVAVPTPSREDGSAELAAVRAVVDEVGTLAEADTVLVVKSTVPVGTCQDLAQRLRGLRDDAVPPVRLAGNPEFLQEGSAVRDVLDPERIVIGTDDPTALAVLERLYAPLIDRGVPLLAMDPASAELTKYAANSMLATRISFMNQLSGLCGATGADIEQVRAGIAADSRIGDRFLAAGIGFGGSCFPKDLRALRRVAAEHGVRLPLIEATLEVNEAQRASVVERLGAELDLAGARIAVWGLAFKPGTGDLRESPALAVVRELLDAGATLVLHDPVAPVPEDLAAHPRVSVATDPVSALRGADGLALLTEWPEYATVEPSLVAGALGAGAPVLDGRNALDAGALQARGLRVLQVGRSAVHPVPEVVPARSARLVVAGAGS